MSSIQTYLDYILSKVYGKDVRQAIVDAINQCYADATAGMTPVITTEQIAGGTRFIVTVGSVSTYFDVMNGISPQVAVANTASSMTDTDLIYVYTGSETGYENGDWYYYDGEEWQDGGVYQSSVPVIDATLSNTGQAADAKKVGDEIADLRGQISATGLKASIREKLLAFLDVVSSDAPNARELYDALAVELNNTELVSINVQFTQGDTEYYLNSPLDDFRANLVVTGYYDDGTIAPVTNYTLSGTLTAGESTITVTAQELTGTFTATIENAELCALDLANPQSVTNCTATYDPTNKTVRVQNTASQWYSCSSYLVEASRLYKYKIMVDAVRTSGTQGMAAFMAMDRRVPNDTGFITADGHYECVWDLRTSQYYQDEGTFMLALYSTYNTKAVGDYTYSNIKVIRWIPEE